MLGAFLRFVLQVTFAKYAMLELSVYKIPPLGPGYGGRRVGEGATQDVRYVTTKNRTSRSSIAPKKSVLTCPLVTFCWSCGASQTRVGQEIPANVIGFPTRMIDLIVCERELMIALWGFRMWNEHPCARCSCVLAQYGALFWSLCCSISDTLLSVVLGRFEVLMHFNRSPSYLLGVLHETSRVQVSWHCCNVAHCSHPVCYDVPDAIYSRCRMIVRQREGIAPSETDDASMSRPAQRCEIQIGEGCRGLLVQLSLGVPYLLNHSGIALLIICRCFNSTHAYLTYCHSDEVDWSSIDCVHRWFPYSSGDGNIQDLVEAVDRPRRRYSGGAFGADKLYAAWAVL